MESNAGVSGVYINTYMSNGNQLYDYEIVLQI